MSSPHNDPRVRVHLTCSDAEGLAREMRRAYEAAHAPEGDE